MKIEIYVCKMCKTKKYCYKYDIKNPNGSFVRKDKKNKVLVPNLCHQCKLINQKKIRTKNKNIHTKRYEKTVNGFLVRVYRNMKSRVIGIQWRKFHLYAGKEILGKEEFYEWSKKSKEFLTLFGCWEKSGYQRKICPSVDRIDSRKGYSLNNMRWVTFSENCRNVREELKRKPNRNLSRI